jgi:superfamily II DNA or RNA helicase
MNTIYAYTTETYRIYRGWLKVGQTHQESAEIRVSQQDGTSNPEPLEIEKTWEVPDWVSDNTIHAELTKMGKLEVRLDKSREWYACTVDDVSTAINNIVLGVSRPNSYPMREEQQECHDKAVGHYQSGGNKFLMNAKMRFGKTFTSYQIMKSLDIKLVLVITYKPAVDAGWREDLNTHVDFDGWNYYSAKDDFSSTNPIEIRGDGKVDILFASFQDFNDFEKAKWAIAKNYHYDMIVIDEMHYGSKTERAQESLAQLTYDHTLYVSGTPLKALMSGEFLDEEIYTWGYADEQRKRKEEKDLGWETELYRWLPEMKFHTFEVTEEAKKLVSAYSEEEGFTMTKMFGSEDGEKFIDESAVKLFLDQVFGIGVRKDQSPIRTHAVDHMLFVLPPNVNSATAMSKLLETRVGDDYKIINVAGDNTKKLDDVRALIVRNQKTITVTCGRFNTGVTVPEWDMVMMLDDTRAPETYFQTIFRCQSPDKKRGKELCSVIDFNPQRCLEMIYEFADITAKPNESTQEAVRSFLEFAPVLDHSGNKTVEVDVNQVLNMMAETGGYAERFGSSVMLNWGSLDRVAGTFFGIYADANTKNKSSISDNGLEKGKNYDSTGRPKTKAEIDEDEKSMKELRQKVITMMRRIPTYLFLEESKIDNVEDIFDANNRELFEETIGITIESFKELCEGFIKTERLDRAIMAYNQIESIECK